MDFLNTVKAGDIDAAWVHLSKDAQAELSNFGGKKVLRRASMSFREGEDLEFRLGKVPKTKDSVTVIVTEVIDGKAMRTSRQIGLIKDQEGKWKVILE